MPNIVSIEIRNVIEHHMTCATGNFASLCGLDGGLTEDGRQEVVPTPQNAKINCQQCKAILDVVCKYKRDDFE